MHLFYALQSFLEPILCKCNNGNNYSNGSKWLLIGKNKGRFQLGTRRSQDRFKRVPGDFRVVSGGSTGVPAGLSGFSGSFRGVSRGFRGISGVEGSFRGSKVPGDINGV